MGSSICEQEATGALARESADGGETVGLFGIADIRAYRKGHDLPEPFSALLISNDGETFGVLAAFIMAICLCGCGGHSAPPKGETSAPPVVSLTLSPILRGTTLFIIGSTDLPNGTVIAYEIRHEGAATRTDVPIEKLFKEGMVTVADGGYSATESLKGWPPGRIEVWAAFPTILDTKAKQPPEIISRFGEMGEKLQGNNVKKAGAIKRVEVTQTIVLRR